MADLPQTNAPLPTQTANPLLDQLLKDLKIDTLPKAHQEQLLGQIKELAERRLLQVIMANLDEAKLAELRQKMEAGAPPEEVGAWVAAQPGLREKVEQEMRVLYESLTNSAAAAQHPQQGKQPVIIPVEQQASTKASKQASPLVTPVQDVAVQSDSQPPAPPATPV